jgi:hypothetical protein
MSTLTAAQFQSPNQEIRTGRRTSQRQKAHAKFAAKITPPRPPACTVATQSGRWIEA